jgi:hypothetical protein
MPDREMSYVVFDLDETMAQLYSVYYFIASLKLKDYVGENRAYMLTYFPENLFQEQERAYRLFVKRVLEEETSATPLGIIRPGILEIMKKLNKLKRRGKVAHVIIYSNNGYLQSLEFIRDLIHLYVGNNTLITECIHRTHSLRALESNWTMKTWDMLRHIFTRGTCHVLENISPANVYFFDDLNHVDLQTHLAEQYYQVPPYTFRPSVERICTIYKKAMEDAKVDTTMLLVNVIELLNMGTVTLNPLDTNLQQLMGLFQEVIRDTAKPSDLPPPPDRGYQMMTDAVEEIKNRHFKMSKVRRRTHKRRRLTIKK